MNLSWSSARGSQKAARSLTIWAASHAIRPPAADGRLAARMISLTVLVRASTSLVSWLISASSRSDSASKRSAVSGVRSWCERSARVSRS